MDVVPFVSSLATARSMTEPLKENTDPASLEAVTFALKSGDFQSRWDAAKMIPAFGEAAIAPLLELLQSEEDQDEEGDWELHWFVARILGNFNHPSAIDALVDILLTTQDAEVAGMAANTLAGLGTAAVPALTELLSRSSTRLIAVQALAQVQHPTVIPALLDVVNDSVPEVRVAAIEALSHFHDDSLIVVLQQALQDPTTSVRRAAVVALGIQADWIDPTTLTQMLSPLLWDLNLDVCRQAAVALGRVGTAAAITVLAQVLQSIHTPTDLRIEVVRALVWMDTTAALIPLKHWLETGRERNSATDPSAARPWAVEREMIAVLGRVESAEARQTAVNLLLHLLETEHPIAQTSAGKQQIALSLGQLQDAGAIELLIPLLADLDVGVRLHTLAALKQLATQGAYECLQMRLADPVSTDPVLKTAIETALQEWQVHADLT